MSECDQVVAQGIVPQVGPAVLLGLNDLTAGQATLQRPAPTYQVPAGFGVVTFDQGRVKRFEFDWTNEIPGLTGEVEVDHDPGIAAGSRARFTGAGGGPLVGNTPLCSTWTIRFSQPVQLRRLPIIDFDGPGNEAMHTVVPRWASLEGSLTTQNCLDGTQPFGARCRPRFDQGVPPGQRCVVGTGNEADGWLNWNSPTVNYLTWTSWHRNNLSTRYPAVEVQMPLEPIRATLVRDCRTGEQEWINTADGVPLTQDQINDLERA